ncbi:MAG: type IV pilin [Candidatus Diapherotrites archaeon]|nr:type IV pilin [Candidatus Diapherotrites archaeon]
MRKGISPIVAVVLLIAIAVIAAVGLYFWVGGLATKQPTPDTPNIITAQTVTCATNAGVPTDVTVMLQNLGTDLIATGQNFTLVANNASCVEALGADLGPGAQVALTFPCALANGSMTDGKSYIIVGPVGVAQATITC